VAQLLLRCGIFLDRPFSTGPFTMRSVVVTGTSSGIGWASAKALIDHGFRVFGSVRKQADADRLVAEFGANFVPLIFDVTREAAVQAAAVTVRAALGGETLAGLVNNAGIAVSGPALELPIAEFRHQFEVNVIGPIIVTQAFAPLLGTDPTLKGAPGRIVMISSVAGQNGNPMTSPYCASKFAIEGFSESLRRELMLFGIDVIVVGPGAIKTPIWDKAEASDFARYADTPYGPVLQRLEAVMAGLQQSALPVEKVGALIRDVLTVPQPKVRYTISPTPALVLMMKYLPKRWTDRMVAKRVGIVPLPRA
jgi:NAD(P)-dependent dehydrogenase (short-subunit alcohol dehydrogenase family)